jgi:hypothetical protein
MWRVQRVFIAAVLAAGISGCALNASDGSTQDQADEPAHAGDPAQNAVVDALQGTINPRAGCSVVQFCNAQGINGTVCVQQGCAVATAIEECGRETQTVCGGHVCPWIFKQLNGALDDLCIHPP